MSNSPDPDSGPRESGGRRGYELAREELEKARARARAEGKEVGAGGTRAPHRGGRRRRSGWTGPGADRWDPQPLGALMNSVAKRSGWTDKVTSGRILASWPELVGPEIAAKATPESLEGGVLQVRAESTAWATQLRLYSGDLVAKIAKVHGHGVVRRIRVDGPTAPSWRKGPLHVRGRGPRDTYG